MDKIVIAGFVFGCRKNYGRRMVQLLQKPIGNCDLLLGAFHRYGLAGNILKERAILNYASNYCCHF